MEFFNNLWYIFTGYTNLILHIFGLKRFSAIKRYYICKKCKYGKGISCKKCGCIIMAKIWAEYPISPIDNKSIGGCPLNPPKW